VEHVAIALYIAIVLGGSWIAVFALLLYRRDRNPAHYYFGLVLGTAMVLLLLDVLSAYLVATGLDPRLWLRVVAEAAHAVAELVHFYAMVRLAYAIVRLALPRAIARSRSHWSSPTRRSSDTWASHDRHSTRNI